MLGSRGISPIQQLLLPVFSVLIVGFSDDVLTARSFARRDERVHPNQELLALGAANVGASVLRGFPVAALGAIVIYAAVRLIDVTAFRRLLAFRRGELVVAVGVRRRTTGRRGRHDRARRQVCALVTEVPGGQDMQPLPAGAHREKMIMRVECARKDRRRPP